jgi:hypothetical protein
MVSGLAWLDSSRADQQRMRELLKMFSEQESRDELGIGQVRDAFSELLFPGTSVLHTRARYLLIDASDWMQEADLHRDIAGALDFPDYYGHNSMRSTTASVTW